jgi:hypothetical protein
VCIFISLVVSKKMPTDLVRFVAREHHLDIDPVWNLIVINQTGGQLYTKKNCDCSTMIGTLANCESSGEQAALARKLRQFRESGWSAAKINRWLQQKGRRMLDDEDKAEHVEKNPPYEAVELTACLRALLEHGATLAGVLWRWYRGDVEESFFLEGICNDRPEEFQAAKLLYLPENILYNMVGEQNIFR